MKYDQIENKFKEIEKLEIHLTGMLQSHPLVINVDEKVYYTDGKKITRSNSVNMMDEFLPISREEILKQYETKIKDKIQKLKNELELSFNENKVV